MKRSGLIGVLTTAVVVFHAWAVPQTARAQALADRVPADAVVYFGWAGTADQAPAFNTSTLKKYFDLAGGSENPLNDLLAIFDAIAEEEGDLQDRLRFAALQRLALAAWQGPTAFYLQAPEAAGDPPVVVVMTAGEIADADLDLLLEELPERDRPRVTSAAGLTFITFNPPAGRLQTRPAANLANNPALTAAVADSQANPAVVLHINGPAVIDLINAAVEANGAFNEQQAWMIGRELSGILDLQTVLFTAGFQAEPGPQGAAWERNLTIRLSDAPKGVFKLLDQAPVGDAELAWVPQDASMVGVSRFDVTKVLDLAFEIANQVDPENGQPSVQGAIDMGSGFVGVDLRTDLINGLGSAWLTYIDPAAAGHSPLGVVAVNPLNNAEGVERSLTAIGELLNAVLAEQLDDEVPFEIRVNKKTVAGVELNIVSVPFVMPTWAVVDNRLIAGLNPQAVLTAAARDADPASSIMANPAFMNSYQAALAGQAPTSLWWTDLPTTSTMAYQNNLIWGSILSGFGAMFDGEAPSSFLPPLGQLQPLLAPDIALGWTEGNAFRWRSITPFPGASAYGPTAGLGGGGTIATAALGTGILLPALGAARESAHQAQEMSNLRQLGIAQMLYANDHQGRFALHADELLPYLGDGQVLLPRGQLAPPPGPDRPELIRRESVVTLVPLPRQNDIADAHQTVMAFRHPGPDDAAVAVLFADGHVEWLSVDQLNTRLQAQTNRTAQELTDQHRGLNAPKPVAD